MTKSDIAKEYIKEKNFRLDVQEKYKTLQKELAKSEKARVKWFNLYFDQHKASERNKQDAANFAKKVTILTQKLDAKFPVGFWKKLLFVVKH